MTSAWSIVGVTPPSMAAAMASSAPSASPRPSADTKVSSVPSTSAPGRAHARGVGAVLLEHFHEGVQEHRVEVLAALLAHHPIASSTGKAGRYTRSLVRASNTSATATMRPSIGIASPFRPRG